MSDNLAERLRMVTPRIKKESYYQTLMENLLGGQHHYIKEAGFTDVTLANAHVEIKDAKKYHQACGQLLKYHLADPRDYLVVVLFGAMSTSVEFLRLFFSHTIATHVLYFDDDDNLNPIYKSTGTKSPYWGGSAPPRAPPT